MVSSILNRLRTLDKQIQHQTRSNEQSQRVDELVDHGVCDVGMTSPDISFGEDASEI